MLMYTQIANAFLTVIYIYLAMGVIIGTFLVSFGMARVDNETTGSGLGFRLIILPGAVALWPLMLRRMIRGGGEPPLQNDPHR